MQCRSSRTRCHRSKLPASLIHNWQYRASPGLRPQHSARDGGRVARESARCHFPGGLTPSKTAGWNTSWRCASFPQTRGDGVNDKLRSGGPGFRGGADRAATHHGPSGASMPESHRDQVQWRVSRHPRARPRSRPESRAQLDEFEARCRTSSRRKLLVRHTKATSPTSWQTKYRSARGSQQAQRRCIRSSRNGRVGTNGAASVDPSVRFRSRSCRPRRCRAS